MDNINSKLKKLNLGQFYSTKIEYIFQGFDQINDEIIEPFAGQGDIINWINGKVIAYDVEPKISDVIRRDTLKNPPNYDDKYVITNPPFRARNKNESKEIYNKYQTNDLYKCFIISLCESKCLGGILILPINFFLSTRKRDVEIRNQFLEKYQIKRINYFEIPVFDDTTTTIVSFPFQRSKKMESQDIEWHRFPNGDSRIFKLEKVNGWIIGGDIYSLETKFKMIRLIENRSLKDGEYLTKIKLNALDTNKTTIGLEFSEIPYYGKISSRTTATLITKGFELTIKEQKKLIKWFNQYLNSEREKYWSLFLPHYREYERKRISFELAYDIVLAFSKILIERR